MTSFGQKVFFGEKSLEVKMSLLSNFLTYSDNQLTISTYSIVYIMINTSKKNGPNQPDGCHVMATGMKHVPWSFFVVVCKGLRSVLE